MSTKKITILAIGGTFDKVYHDALSDYRIGEPQSTRILQQAGVRFDYRIETLIQKDSLDMNDDDRRRIKEAIEADDGKYFVMTHGTDTMVETAKALGTPAGKPLCSPDRCRPRGSGTPMPISTLGLLLAR